LVAEARALTRLPDFKGYIHDVGGPTANFRAPACGRPSPCPHRHCLVPEPCPNLRVSHRDYLLLLRELRALEGVKKVFVRSGIRFDYLLRDADQEFFWELCRHHISGQLKVAPEHVAPAALAAMNKPPHEVYEAFTRRFYHINQQLGARQYLVPYFLSSHPGCDLAAAVQLAEYLRDTGQRPEQVQDFYPTPGTVSTCMYHTGQDPFTGQPLHVPRSPREKAMQRALIQYHLPQNRPLVLAALREAGREDRIDWR
jgi:uncharacterized radical SAM protein YgiQ